MAQRRLSSRVNRRGLLKVAGAAASLPFAAACARRVAPSTGSTGSKTTPAEKDLALGPDQAYDCTPGKEAWRAPGPPKRGGTLAKASLDFSHLDPTTPGGGPNDQAPQVYNTLYSFRGCFFEDTTLVPDLARAYTASPDGLTWTLHLRDDVKWHNKPPVNGRPFSSADVAWTLEYQLQAGLGKNFWAGVEKHEEPDPTTIVLHLKAPDAEFLDKLGAYTNLILPREVQEKYGNFKTAAIGTGAFMLKDFKQNQEVTLERNPAYHLTGIDGKPLPYVDNVHVIHFGDPAAEVAAMRAGSLDMSNYRGFSKVDADAVHQANPKLRIYQQVQYAIEGLWFDCRKAPWNDVRVRKALSLAINRDDLITASQGGLTYSGFLPRGITSYAWSLDTLKQKFKADPEQAKALLAQAGYKPGDLKATLTSAEIHRQNVQVVQQQLKAVGVEATIAFGNESSTLLLQKGNWDFAWLTQGGGTTAGSWVDIVRSDSATFRTRLSDPTIDQLANAQARELDAAKRKTLIGRLQDSLYEVMAFAPGTSTIYQHVMSPRLKNTPLVNQTYNPITVVHAWLDPSAV